MLAPSMPLARLRKPFDVCFGIVDIRPGIIKKADDMRTSLDEGRFSCLNNTMLGRFTICKRYAPSPLGGKFQFVGSKKVRLPKKHNHRQRLISTRSLPSQGNDFSEKCREIHADGGSSIAAAQS